MDCLIKYKNVTINHAEQNILNNVDIQINEGDFVYIIGKVGSGKSTLLQSFYYESDIMSAEVCEVLGKDMLTLRRKDVPVLRKQMGIIFQDFQLLSDRNIEQNLRFVLRATGWKGKSLMDERIESVLNLVDMKHCMTKMPHQLSGGEQQRIAIARALLNNPKIILADEPTNNLDTETANNIISILQSIREQGTAVIMSTHNMNIIEQYQGKIYVCDNQTLTLQTSEDVAARINQEN